MHVKKGDTVQVLTGKDLGKRGKVLRVFPDKGKVLVEGINVMKKHQKPTAKVMQGGIVDKEAPLSGSNVMVVCPKCDRPTRVRRQVLEDKSSTRTCRRCGEIVDR